MRSIVKTSERKYKAPAGKSRDIYAERRHDRMKTYSEKNGMCMCCMCEMRFVRAAKTGCLASLSCIRTQ